MSAAVPARVAAAVFYLLLIGLCLLSWFAAAVLFTGIAWTLSYDGMSGAVLTMGGLMLVFALMPVFAAVHQVRHVRRRRTAAAREAASRVGTGAGSGNG